MQQYSSAILTQAGSNTEEQKTKYEYILEKYETPSLDNT